MQAVRAQLAASSDENFMLKQKLELLSARQQTSRPTPQHTNQPAAKASIDHVEGVSPEEEEPGRASEGKRANREAGDQSPVATRGSSGEQERAHRNVQRDAEVRARSC